MEQKEWERIDAKGMPGTAVQTNCRRLISECVVIMVTYNSTLSFVFVEKQGPVCKNNDVTNTFGRKWVCKGIGFLPKLLKQWGNTLQGCES
ncbi:MAG: hypothetical protein LJE88_09585, partial [Deltaproteobacteria bacterium]|nr:hypothetical protein [Deltaproteobacteria bacterium]